MVYSLFFFSYGGGFNREGLWIFFTLGILSCLLALSFIVRTCIAIQPKKEKKPEDETEEKKDTRLALALKVVIARYNDFTDVNGKYYLTKMYAAEAFEHTQQVYSLTKIYLCLMPVEISQPSTEKCNGIFTKEVWGGCKVPVPFCQDPFVAK